MNYSKWMFGCFAALSFSMLIACGGDKISYITELNQTVGKLDAGEKLGVCSPDIFGETVFVTDSAAIFFCNDYNWVRMTFADEKDTVVIKDSVYVFEADSGCSFKILDGKVYTLVCESDTLWFDKKDPVSSTDKVEYGVFTDSRDGAKYKTIEIGTKTWMSENLNFGDSAAVPELVGKSWCYNGDLDKCAEYGRLYTFDAAKSACPAGWRLPSEDDWNELLDKVLGDGGSKEWKDGVPYLISSTGWSGVDAVGDFDFSAYPAGTKKYNSDSFYGLGDETNFWNEDGSCLMIKSNSLIIESHVKNYGFSVRCVKNT